jgi:cold shock CspA family protein
MTLKIHGRIEYWNPQRGFGFISDSKKDVSRFFHASNVVDGNPQVGAACFYDAGETKKGKVALNVEVKAGV